MLQNGYVPDFMIHKYVKNEGKLTKYLMKNNHDSIIPLRTREYTQEKIISKNNKVEQNHSFS